MERSEVRRLYLLAALAKGDGADLAFERPFRGYAQYAVLALPAEPKTP